MAAQAKQTATLETSMGTIVCELYADQSPNTVANFVGLASGTKEYTDPKTGKPTKGKYYDGLIFHRVIPNFMIQGGDPNTKDPAKESSYGEGTAGYRIKAEFNDHPHERGVISMAREAQPDTASCQFFICLQPVHRLDHQYATFGKLIKGLDVLDKIGDTPTVTGPDGARSKPTERVTINSVEIVPADSVK